MKKYILASSTRKNKRYMVIDENGKTVHFGSPSHQNLLIHKDQSRKERYINRHRKNENWDDPNTPGFWSKHLLWNQTTLFKSIEDIKKKYNIHVHVYEYV